MVFFCLLCNDVVVNCTICIHVHVFLVVLHSCHASTLFTCATTYRGELYAEVQSESVRLKEEDKDERKGKDASGSVHHELLTRIQELEDESKDSEQMMMELRHENNTLQTNLIASREEEGRSRQLVASLREELQSVLRPKVRKRVSWRHKTDRLQWCKFHVLPPWCLLLSRYTSTPLFFSLHMSHNYCNTSKKKNVHVKS